MSVDDNIPESSSSPFCTSPSFLLLVVSGVVVGLGIVEKTSAAAGGVSFDFGDVMERDVMVGGGGSENKLPAVVGLFGGEVIEEVGLVGALFTTVVGDATELGCCCDDDAVVRLCGDGAIVAALRLVCGDEVIVGAKFAGDVGGGGKVASGLGAGAEGVEFAGDGGGGLMMDGGGAGDIAGVGAGTLGYVCGEAAGGVMEGSGAGVDAEG